MHNRDAVFLEDLCPKLRDRRWRKSLHEFTDKTCMYCGKNSESIESPLIKNVTRKTIKEKYEAKIKSAAAKKGKK